MTTCFSEFYGREWCVWETHIFSEAQYEQVERESYVSALSAVYHFWSGLWLDHFNTLKDFNLNQSIVTLTATVSFFYLEDEAVTQVSLGTIPYLALSIFPSTESS